MYLQKLEIQGFKSFAQKTVLEFNRELTAVVGPNGSGKSNIADAIRWVLGEQSVKLLRGKRAEDVIFAGSTTKSRLGMAEVSLHLNNNDGGSLADYSEIIVTRRVYRDGQSEYLLNGESVRLQDILILLARANFGQKTYSVIGQGMVDSILLATPTERKEFFEEATGVKQYQLKREQAVQKLLTTYTNLEQGQALLTELEPNLRTLTRQVKRLEQRQELEQELSGKQKLYYRFRFHTLENERQVVVKQNGDITSKLQSARELSADLQERLKILSQTALTQGIFDSQKKIDNLRSDLNQALREQAHLQAEAKIKLIERGEGEVAWLKEREVELSQKVKELKQAGENLQVEKTNTEKLLAEAIARESSLVLPEELSSGNDWLVRALQKIVNDYGVVRNNLIKAQNLNDIKILTNSLNDLESDLKTILRKLSTSSELSAEVVANFQKQREEILQQIGRHEGGLKFINQQIEDNSREQKIIVESHDNIKRTLSTSKSADDFETNDKLTAKLATKIGELENNLHTAEVELKKVQSALGARQTELVNLQQESTQALAKISALSESSREAEMVLVRLETKLEDLEREMAEDLSPEFCREIKLVGVVAEIDEGRVALELQKLKAQLELTGGIEPEVAQEFQQVKTRHDFLTKQIADLTLAAASLESVIRDLDTTIHKQFMVNFNAINDKFAKYFKVVFGGGKAQLVLQEVGSEKEVVANESDGGEERAPTLSEKFLAQEKKRSQIFAGVEITATPPSKRLSAIAALSGGEKALTAIALLCAIISNHPSPFVVLDEVDAALDEANSERYAAILESLMSDTQFITITHNRATMRRASILYGVTMGEDGVSKLLSVKLDQADEMVK